MKTFLICKKKKKIKKIIDTLWTAVVGDMATPVWYCLAVTLVFRMVESTMEKAEPSSCSEELYFRPFNSTVSIK